MMAWPNREKRVRLEPTEDMASVTSMRPPGPRVLRATRARQQLRALELDQEAIGDSARIRQRCEAARGEIEPNLLETGASPGKREVHRTVRVALYEQIHQSPGHGVLAQEQISIAEQAIEAVVLGKGTVDISLLRPCPGLL